MTMQILPDNHPLSLAVLPSVWTAYKKPACRPITEMVDQTSQAFQMGYKLSKEDADKLSNDFWTGSVHDFCVQHLGEDLTDEDHGKILKQADEAIKNKTVIKINENETDLVKLLVAKVVLNAHQRANHAMSHACFLNEHDMLPNESVFMFQKGISPVFYDKSEFDRSETLADKVHGVPEDRLLNSFTNWFNHSGMRYMSAFNQMGPLLNDMRYMNALILKKSIESRMRAERKMHYRHRARPRRRSWRSYGE